MIENGRRASSQISPSTFGCSENETAGQRGAFLGEIVVLALLNSLGKDRALPHLPISCPSPPPTPKNHSNGYSTHHSKALVFHASLNLWVESTGESQGSALPLSTFALRFLSQFLNWPCLRCVALRHMQRNVCKPCVVL